MTFLKLIDIALFFFESSTALIISSFVEINENSCPVFALSIILFLITLVQIDQMPSVLIPNGSVPKQIRKPLSVLFLFIFSQSLKFLRTTNKVTQVQSKFTDFEIRCRKGVVGFKTRIYYSLYSLVSRPIPTCWCKGYIPSHNWVVMEQ